MSNARGKKIDKTYLSVDKAEERGFIHRDYIAHCLRWSHVIKRLGEKHAFRSARILDIGCGRELPLAKLLYSSKYIVEQYYGVDVGPINDSALSAFDSGKFPIKVWENTNILDITSEDVEGVNWATMFEVAEHVEPLMLIDMLSHIRSLMTPNGTFFVSTPCWNRTDVAANHVNEMTYEAFGALLEDCGWNIVNVSGTFASIRDYEHLLGDYSKYKAPILRTEDIPTKELFNRLRSYYDTNFLSCIFAPLFPAQSRNCLWELTPAEPDLNRKRKKFPKITNCQRPWGSSERWEEMSQLPLL